MTLGWYVHHHGAGHLTRFLAVRPHLDGAVVVLSSLPEPSSLPTSTRWIALPRDDDGFAGATGAAEAPEDADATVGGLLHWAPLGHAGHRARLAAIADIARDEALAGMVVDVSVEVALFSRLLGLPTVVMSQPGDRTDEPHRIAYRAASAIVAPWPEGVLSDAALLPVRDRVRWTGGISRYEPVPSAAATVPPPASGGGGVVVLGAHPHLDRDGLRLVAERAGLTVTEVGATAESWTTDPWPHLEAADVVVTAAGQNSIADLAAARVRAVVVPQERPFGEQHATGRALERLDLAIVASDPRGVDEWARLLDRALGLRPEWDRWEVAGAAQRAADRIREVTS
ncbi:glycosyltransferase [Cnuibacter sp. UC19_7]|uniref:glycosyltransferase n=1 Tax=Cnuibacter sp. UC19_7 TaxID=3350166 RepID=UPI00366BD0EB